MRVRSKWVKAAVRKGSTFYRDVEVLRRLPAMGTLYVLSELPNRPLFNTNNLRFLLAGLSLFYLAKLLFTHVSYIGIVLLLVFHADKKVLLSQKNCYIEKRLV